VKKEKQQKEHDLFIHMVLFTQKLSNSHGSHAPPIRLRLMALYKCALID